MKREGMEHIVPFFLCGADQSGHAGFARLLHLTGMKREGM